MVSLVTLWIKCGWMPGISSEGSGTGASELWRKGNVLQHTRRERYTGLYPSPMTNRRLIDKIIAEPKNARLL